MARLASVGPQTGMTAGGTPVSDFLLSCHEMPPPSLYSLHPSTSCSPHPPASRTPGSQSLNLRAACIFR